MAAEDQELHKRGWGSGNTWIEEPRQVSLVEHQKKWGYLGGGGFITVPLPNGPNYA